MPISGFHPCVNLSERYGPPARGAFVGKGRNSGKFSPGSGSRTLGAVLSKAHDLICAKFGPQPSGALSPATPQVCFSCGKKNLESGALFQYSSGVLVQVFVSNSCEDWLPVPELGQQPLCFMCLIR